jgi:hypothetical protein
MAAEIKERRDAEFDRQGKRGTINQGGSGYQAGVIDATPARKT